MRKNFLLALVFFTSCAGDDYDRRNVRFEEHANKIDARYVRPSESMQVGIPKSNLEQQMEKQYFNTYSSNKSGPLKIDDSYEVSGASYFPQNYEEFEEVGIASWYGIDFHGKYTSNGEIYDSNAMTAAHPTLPLPSMVRVTNLRNGRTVIVRVNDRGPFSKERIIDVSEKAADELQFKNQGTTKVYIQLLRNDTDAMMRRIQN